MLLHVVWMLALVGVINLLLSEQVDRVRTGKILNIASAPRTSRDIKSIEIGLKEESRTK